METKAFKDMGKEKLDYACSVDVFETRGKDYPFISLWLTMTSKESWPEDGGRLVIRFTESCLNRRSMEEGIGESSGHVGW